MPRFSAASNYNTFDLKQGEHSTLGVKGKAHSINATLRIPFYVNKIPAAVTSATKNITQHFTKLIHSTKKDLITRKLLISVSTGK